MDNRSNLLDHALNLFAERGYDAVGVQEVVESAGVTKPTLYHYFVNKRGLLDALLDRGFNRLLAGLAAAADYHGDLTLTLRNIVMAYFDFCLENSIFYRLQLSMAFAPPGSEPNQSVIRYTLEQYQVIENMFILAVKENGNMRGRQREYSATFIGMINTWISMYLNGSVELDEALARRAVHQFMHGILS